MSKKLKYPRGTYTEFEPSKKYKSHKRSLKTFGKLKHCPSKDVHLIDNLYVSIYYNNYIERVFMRQETCIVSGSFVLRENIEKIAIPLLKLMSIPIDKRYTDSMNFYHFVSRATIIRELNYRFREEQNIEWLNKLKEKTMSLLTNP